MHAILAPYILLSIYSGFPGSTTALTGGTVVRAQPAYLDSAISREAEKPPTLAQITLKGGIPYVEEGVPTVDLSTYFPRRGSEVTATAKGFTPEEWVLLRFGSRPMEQKLADKNGTVTFEFEAPLGGVSLELTVEGLSSNIHIARIIKIAR